MWAEVADTKDLSGAGGSASQVVRSHGWQTDISCRLVPPCVGFSMGLQGSSRHTAQISSEQEVKDGRKEAAISLASKVTYHYSTVFCCSHRSAIIQCERRLHKAVDTSEELDTTSMPWRSKLDLLLGVCSEEQVNSFPENFFPCRWPLLKLGSVARTWDWAKWSLSYMPHYLDYTR